VITSLQRGYAFAVFLLREFIRSISADRFFEWKAQVVMSASQSFLILAAIYTFSVARGARVEVLESKRSFLVFSIGCATLLYFANGYAAERLLPRFKEQFERLDRRDKRRGVIALLLLVLLCYLAMTAAAYAARQVLGTHASVQ
jgi:hypothetical protein